MNKLLYIFSNNVFLIFTIIFMSEAKHQIFILVYSYLCITAVNIIDNYVNRSDGQVAAVMAKWPQ